MKCVWTDVPGTTDARGWRKVKCERCGFTSPNTTPHEHKLIDRECDEPGLGDWVSHVIALCTGLDKKRVTRLLRRLGLLKPDQSCACPARQTWLNSVGWWISSWFRSLFGPRNKERIKASQEVYYPIADSPSTPTQLQYVTSAQRVVDTLKLLPKLPRDLAAVCGISRSGIAPAVELAMALHLPLYILSEQRGIIEPGFGYRLSGNEKLRQGPILIVDDSRGTGRSQARAMPIAVKHWRNRELIFAVVYCNTLSLGAPPLPDIWSVELNDHHLFEWNLFNSPFWMGRVGYDFDGVLCHDGASCAASATLLHAPRRDVIPLVCTGRHESSRAECVAWLEEHRIRVKRLVMWQGGDLHEGDPWAVSRYKAQHYAALHKLSLFVESDDRQAREIAELSKKATLCTTTGKVYQVQ